MIIVTAAGCDNVDWGGAEVRLQPPPPVETPEVDSLAAESPEGPPPPPLPTGPVLYMGTRSDARVTLRPVAELRGDTLLPLSNEDEAPGFAEHFRATRLRPGTEFLLFAGGSRVGTLVADTSDVVTGTCTVHPTVSGTPELLLQASGATRFLALRRTDGAVPGHAGYVADRETEEARRGSLNLASRVIMREDAYWPDDLGRARADLHVVPTPDSAGVGVAATFMFRDELAVAPSPTPVAYSLFVLGSAHGESFQLAYDWYQVEGEGGKKAARWFGAADWDGDGQNEILLEVLGEDTRWVAALDRRDGDRWERVFEEPCTQRTNPAADR